MVYCERLQQRESNSTLLPSQVNFQRNTDQWIEERKQCDEMTGRSSSYSSHDQSTSPPRTDPVTAAIFQREFSSYPTSDFRNGSYHLQEPDTNQEQMRNQQQMLVIAKNKNQQAEDMMSSSAATAPPPDRNTLSSIICRAEEQQCNPLMVQITKMIHEVEGYLDDLHDIQIKNAVLMDDLVMAGANF